MLYLLAAFAQQAREQISQWTKAAYAWMCFAAWSSATQITICTGHSPPLQTGPAVPALMKEARVAGSTLRQPAVN